MDWFSCEKQNCLGVVTVEFGPEIAAGHNTNGVEDFAKCPVCGTTYDRVSIDRLLTRNAISLLATR